MRTEIVHSPVRPDEITYSQHPSKTAECWIRKNIREEVVPSESIPGTTEEDMVDIPGESIQYVYEEVYFRTDVPEQEIRDNADKYWDIAAEWEPDVPVSMSQEQRINNLEIQLKEANAALVETQMNNDMAIAELTMIMATMMGGGV